MESNESDSDDCEGCETVQCHLVSAVVIHNILLDYLLLQLE